MIYDEIVIGAGMAGLYWVYKTKPINYLILEKNDRIGGRIFNINWNENQISLGGGIIKHNNTYTINLCKKFGFDLIDGISQYEMIDWAKQKKTDEPNEKDFYNFNKNIIKYLKKIYKLNENEINTNKYNFEEFLNLYVDLELNQVIKSNLLYKTYFKSEVPSVLYDEMDELLRTEVFRYKFIANGGYTKLLNELIEQVEKQNIKTNCNIIQIMRKFTESNEIIYEIITASNLKYCAKKIILATESENSIKFDFESKYEHLEKKIARLYSMVSGSNYLRVYSYHPNGHGLKYSYKTSGLLGKVIPIGENILMCSYTEESDAVKLNNLIKNKTIETQCEIIYKLLINCNIVVTKPNDIIIKFWNTGVHYNSINYNKEEKKKLLNELKNNNIIIIGECIADSHGWVNSALESVEFISQS